MARDAIVGTWQVTQFEGGLAKFKYKYTFSTPPTSGTGLVRWADFYDPSSNGVGTWTRSGNQINLDWKASETIKENLVIPPTDVSDTAAGEARATYGVFSTVAERLDSADPSQDLIAQWAANYGDFKSPYICPWAIPYLLTLPSNTPPYKQSQIGGPMLKVNGLAIHTTWSSPSLSREKAVGSCIRTWNAAGVKTGAHFIIVTSGELIQVVPTNRIAYAQGGSGDPFKLSVEIQTLNSPATPPQLQSAGFLFRWVADSFGCDKKLATGYVGDYGHGPFAADAKRAYDPITRKMCTDVTTNVGDAVASSGLSCHYWLHPVKPCPGVPLLEQLSLIARGS